MIIPAYRLLSVTYFCPYSYNIIVTAAHELRVREEWQHMYDKIR
jgi:hypothetical protein